MIRALILACFAVTLAAPAVTIDEYRARRDALRRQIGDGTLVLHGATLAEQNFHYLTGRRDPGGILLMTAQQTVLYLSRRDDNAIKWTGQQLWAEDDVAAATGMSGAPLDCFAEDLRALKTKRIWTLSRSREELRKVVPGVEFEDAAKLAALLRMKKSPGELALLRRSIDATIGGQRAAWKVLQPGKFEYQLGAAISQVYLDQGCERHAFPPILGSGPNGVVLHYYKNSRRMDAGELVVIDTGAECAGYAGDLTRTVPVNGKFSPRQRELYLAVLEAERAVIAAARPGITIKELRQVAIDTLNAGGRNLGQYMTHGVSHHVGLEVHDAADNAKPLEAGAVITVEPGIYLPAESVGIRIEDMILITAGGAKLLSGDLPVEPGEIERAIANRKR
jgi:Xaa-Pro aminopeptidase